MLKMSPTRLAKNSPLLMDVAEDAVVGSGMSFTTRSAENLLASVDIAEDTEIGKGDDSDNKTIK